MVAGDGLSAIGFHLPIKEIKEIKGIKKIRSWWVILFALGDPASPIPTTKSR
jgi:hypothetical protein